MNDKVRGSTELHRIRGSGFPFRAELLKTGALSSQATLEESKVAVAVVTVAATFLYDVLVSTP